MPIGLLPIATARPMIDGMPIFLANEDGTYVPARTTSSASLVILSVERRPDEITTHLGMTPDRWWLAGEFESHPQDPRWRRSRPHPFDGWELASRLPEDAAPDAHLVDLLDRIGDAADRVSALVADPRIRSVRLWLVHHSDNENPGFSLNAALVERLNRLGTGLDVDVYALDEPIDGE
jgi:hypothetical protein